MRVAGKRFSAAMWTTRRASANVCAGTHTLTLRLARAFGRFEIRSKYVWKCAIGNTIYNTECRVRERISVYHRQRPRTHAQ